MRLHTAPDKHIDQRGWRKGLVMMVETVFVLSVLGGVYSYFLYPVLLILLPRRPLPEPRQEKLSPTLTVIITAHNEASRIRDKLENTLALDYEPGKLEVMVASDASDDGTDDIAGSVTGVRLVRSDEHKGKEYAQLQAIRQAKGDIIVFSDVATDIPADALYCIAECFEDPRVGAVSSEDRFMSRDGKVAGEGAYVKYEMWLRRLESQLAGLVGLSGSFFAARKEVCEQWDHRVPSDFNTALNAVRCGYVAVSSPKVLGYYQDIKDDSKEYRRKVRTVIRGISAIFTRPDVLNPFVYGGFAFQVWSHKIMRWLVPWFMVLALMSNLMIVHKHWIFQAALSLQVLLYILALTGYLLPASRNAALVKIPFFFVQVNVAIAQASLQFMTGKRVTVWKPSQR